MGRVGKRLRHQRVLPFFDFIDGPRIQMWTPSLASFLWLIPDPAAECCHISVESPTAYVCFQTRFVSGMHIVPQSGVSVALLILNAYFDRDATHCKQLKFAFLHKHSKIEDM